MDQVSKSELKAKMFEYFRKVESTKRPLVVSDFGEPVLIIHPYRKKQSIDELFGSARNNLSLDRDKLLESESEEWGELS